MTEARCREYVQSHRQLPRKVVFKPGVRASMRLFGGLGAFVILVCVGDNWSEQARLRTIATRGKTAEATVVSTHTTGGKHVSFFLTVAFQDSSSGRHRFTENVPGKLFDSCAKGSAIEVTYIPGNGSEAFIGGLPRRVEIMQRDLVTVLLILLIPISIFVLVLMFILRERRLLMTGIVCPGTIDVAQSHCVRFTFSDREGQILQRTMRSIPFAPLLGYNLAGLLEPGSHEPVVYSLDEPGRAALPRYATFCTLVD